MSPHSPRRGTASRPGNGRSRTAPLRLTGARGVYAVHGSGPVPEPLAAAAQALDAVTGAWSFPATATVLVGAGFDDLDALYDTLEPALKECREAGTTLLRLVMSGGAGGSGDRPAPASALSERWGVDVLAPAGVAVVVPGGTLFAPELPDRAGGWWQHSATRRPRPLGPRHPVPTWQGALDRVPLDGVPGCVVEHIPAGLLIQPAGAPPEGVDAIRYALPVDPDGPVLLVDTAGRGQVPPDAVADVLAVLPAAVRGTVRLVSSDGTDLLALGQEVADLLGTEVQVANGVTVLLEEGPAAAPRPARGARQETPWGDPGQSGGSPRTVLLDADGNPSWQPYVRALTCRPTNGDVPAAPRIDNWRAPIGGLRPGADPGTLLLDKKWQVTVVRAGLWIGAHKAVPPRTAVERPVRADVMAVDIGLPGQPLDDSLLAPLEKLFTSLQDDVRAHTLIQLLGDPTPETLRALRRLAIRHEVALRSGAVRPEPVRAGGRAVAAPVVTSTPTPTVTPVAPAAVAPVAPAPVAPVAPVAPAVVSATITTGMAGTAGAASPAGTGAGAPAATAAPVATPAPVRPAPVPPPAPAPAPPAPPSGTGAPEESAPASLSTPAADPALFGIAPFDPGLLDGPPQPAGREEPEEEPEEPAHPLQGHGGEGDEDEESAAPPYEEPTPATPLGATGSDPLPGASAPRPPTGNAPAREERPATAARTAQATALGPVTNTRPPAMPRPNRTEPTWKSELPRTTDPERAPWPPLPPAPDPDTDPAPGSSDDSDLALPATPLAGLMTSTAPDGEAPPAPAPAPVAPPETDPETAPDADPDPYLHPSPSPSPEPEATAPDLDPDPEPEAALPDSPDGPDAPDLRTVTWLPVRPSHRPAPAERDGVRAGLGERWDNHAGAVTRALTRLPALRNTADPEDAAADLTVLHAYLAEESGIRRALLESLAAGGGELLPLLGCVASGLRRLPSYRGAAVRSAGGALGEAAELLLPGEELGETGPIGAVGFDKVYPAVPADHYLIWSMTGRKAAAALVEPDPAAGPDGDTAAEVLFAPGTRLRVLQVARRGAAQVVLLRELPEAAPPAAPGRLDDTDSSVLKRLLGLLELAAAPGTGAEEWPERRTGALGVLAPDA
ncbi:hypothetical protein AB0O01_36390 [Streptomyces sp. NPDC093252]|uniref:hypothetical protein n=1 Tax=Streptomyces sp. NPDC093252 TaxID=3154980 RepID=UPI0034418DC8